MGRATQKMIEYAGEIADYLNIPPPDYSSFEATSDFIDEYKDEYWQERRDNGDL